MTTTTTVARPRLRAVYTDLDGALLGRGGSIFRDADGAFTLRPAEALGACFDAGVEVVPTTARKAAQAAADARMLGSSSVVYELGCAVLIDGSRHAHPRVRPVGGPSTPAGRMAESGIPELLFAAFPGRLEYHDPWHLGREFTVLMRGNIDLARARDLLRGAGRDDLEVVDNGVIDQRMPGVGEVHAYHLVLAGTSKAGGVRLHQGVRGYAREECIAYGDSFEDLGLAEVVSELFVPANGPRHDSRLAVAIGEIPNATVTAGSMGDGFFEAVHRVLRERGQLG
jgi:hydroxymethylpyrimidine pyrophosphatase-like HAD family hydrolase